MGGVRIAEKMFKTFGKKENENNSKTNKLKALNIQFEEVHC